MTAKDAPPEDWGPFGRPLFDTPETKALSRVGVVDIGSNSVRLVIFDGAARSPAYFYNEKVLCALGAGLAETGHLSPEGRRRALQAIHRFQRLARAIDLPPLAAVATAAVREASDGAAFCDEVLRETGLRLQVIDGAEEARLSAQGVLLGWPGSYGLVCDIGGASMELAEIGGGQVGRRITSPLGPLKLANLDPASRQAHIRDVVEDLALRMGPQHDRLFLVGGSWRAIARVDMVRRGYPLRVLHEYRMTVEDVVATEQMIAAKSMDNLRRSAGVSSGRAALVPLAVEVLSAVVQRFEPADIAISSYGIREGLLYEQMPEALRTCDPLIEACRWAEAKEARLPGAGRRLFQFVSPLFAQATPAQLRIVKAACLLHDVSWRAHPDYRAETCFDYATRANLGGLKHSERIFLGLALMHRYRSKHEGTRFSKLANLLDGAAQRDAEILGRAMRLGALLFMESDDAASARLDWSPQDARLTLALDPKVHLPLGEVAEERLRRIANVLHGTSDVVEIGAERDAKTADPA